MSVGYPPARGDPLLIPCPRCGAPLVEDLDFLRDARCFDLDVRQWRCLNGHSVTWNALLVERRDWLVACDVCGGSLLTEDRPEHREMRRHPACEAEHHRARNQTYEHKLLVGRPPTRPDGARTPRPAEVLEELS